MALKEKLLSFYHISEEEYKELTKPVTLTSFNDGHELTNAKEVAEFVKQAMLNKDKIVIYGDYDADGIMGTSILKKSFDYLSYPSDYYIPCRYIDGYGITLAKAKEFVSQGYNLVICVDNGISAFEPIAYLKENNVKVVVIDHHTVGETLPKADMILHPSLSNLGEYSSSGAFTAFMFSRILLGRVDKYLATLASISLISDMMPLKGYNRNLLRVVMANYKRGEFKNLDLLIDDEPFDDNTIGMKVAPRINAIGRMIEDTSINEIVKYFTSDDEKFILTFFNYINSTNEARKNLSKEAAEKIGDITSDSAIVEVVDLKEGLIGLVANSLMNEHHVPAVILTLDSSGEFYKGSARSPLEAFNIVEVFNKLNKYLLAYGGHALAGGCSIKKDCLADFTKEFKEIAKATDLTPKEKESIPLNLYEVSRENYELIRSFAPFGENWPAPYFYLRRIPANKLMYSRDGNHILTIIGQSSKLIGFNFPKTKVDEYKFIDMFGNLRLSTYKGYVTTEFLVKDIKESI